MSRGGGTGDGGGSGVVGGTGVGGAEGGGVGDGATGDIRGTLNEQTHHDKEQRQRQGEVSD